MGWGALAFNAPLILAALIALPAIYWLLRVTPPAPRHVRFPAIRLLLGLSAKDETPAHTPLWLLVLRLLIAALVILALAQPVLNPTGESSTGDRPLVLVVDDDWSTAADWPLRQEVIHNRLEAAARADRLVVLARTTPTENGDPPPLAGPMRAAAALPLVEEWTPRPWTTRRADLVEPLASLPLDGSAQVLWLTNGLADAQTDVGFAGALRALGPVSLLSPERIPAMLNLPEHPGGVLSVEVAGVEPLTDATVLARAGDGRLIERLTVTADADDPTRGVAQFSLPPNALNEVTRLELSGPPTAGGVALVDRRWRRHGVGLVAIGDPGLYPLLSPLHYLEQALAPFADPSVAPVNALVADDAVSVILATDAGLPGATAREELSRWIDDGGVFVQFSGPRLAESDDPLVPVRLRTGGRLLSGSLSWTEPMPLAPFPAASPFAGLAAPADLQVRRQVLAEPSPDLPDRTWAQLRDGTPLVTAERRGRGWLVLFHVGARPSWSNLPISGLFVEMLSRIADLATGAAPAEQTGPLPPLATLDAFGRVQDPPTAVRALPADLAEIERPGPHHPPGLYGTEAAARAFNLGNATAAPVRLEPPTGMTAATLAETEETVLLPWLLAAALVLLAADAIAVFWLKGGLPRLRSRGPVATGLIAAAILAGAAAGPETAWAQTDEDPDAFALRMSTQTHLAYIRTGDPEVDQISAAGLDGLSRILRLRTAAVPVGAVGVDPEVDELSFFPLLYWPITATQAPPSPAALERLAGYMQTGGTLLFDTRDGRLGGNAALGGQGQAALRQLTAQMDLPPLIPVPPEHVLTRSFYLLQDFPGRYVDGDVWVEDTDSTVNDGVSSVIIGANDWAAAWAMDPGGRPMLPVVPGGDRQREMAYRFGVNLVMYALTGNYKDDQVHLPAILERLSQ